MEAISGVQGPRVVGRRTPPGAGKVARPYGGSASQLEEPSITEKVIAMDATKRRRAMRFIPDSNLPWSTGAGGEGCSGSILRSERGVPSDPGTPSPPARRTWNALLLRVGCHVPVTPTGRKIGLRGRGGRAPRRRKPRRPSHCHRGDPAVTWGPLRASRGALARWGGWAGPT